MSKHDTLLYLTEIFGSIQGETSYTGLPTTFVRLSGCNLRCTWCDTPYSFSRGNKHTVDSVIASVEQYGHQHVCITGGEPLLQQPVHTLMARLCDAGYRVSIETGGSLPINTVDTRVKVVLDLKCPGSGMENHNLWDNIAVLKAGDEVKFVIKDRVDYDYAVKTCEQYQLYDRPVEILFSPVFESLKPRQLAEWLLGDRLPVRLNLQTHKYIWEPQTRGV